MARTPRHDAREGEELPPPEGTEPPPEGTEPLPEPAPQGEPPPEFATLRAVIADFAGNPPFGAQQGTYHFGPADRFHGRQVDAPDGLYSYKQFGWTVEVASNELKYAVRADRGEPEERATEIGGEK